MGLRAAALVGILGLTGVSAAAAASPEIESPHIYLSPTVGTWRWDSEALGPNRKPADTGRMVVGARAGYAPFEAISGEVVFLTGTNDVVGVDAGAQVRLTQIELSFVVNFRTLINARWYPFVDLGAGVALRSTDLPPDPQDDDPPFDGPHVAFHLGGGLKVDLTSRASLRFNLRDTFYTETRVAGNQEVQSTVDAVELSVGLDYRFPLGKSGVKDRLR